MIDLPEFDVTIPLVRRNADGSSDSHDVMMRIPAIGVDAAQAVAEEIAGEIMYGLPKTPDNNRHGWKLARYGVAVEPAKVQR